MYATCIVSMIGSFHNTSNTQNGQHSTSFLLVQTWSVSPLPSSHSTEMRKPYSSGVRLLATMSVIASASATATKLVVFAGPHKSASTAVEEFFHVYASGHSRSDHDGNKLVLQDRKKTFGLRYWLWPQISGVASTNAEPENPSKIFGHLVTDSNDSVLKSEILDGIRVAWETEGIDGVIIGSELFDQVGPSVDYDASKAVSEIVEFINTNPTSVTVVLNYRTPRLDHWASMWKHEATGVSPDGENFALEYEQWLCDKAKADQHVNVLSTQMSPFNAAEAYVKLGFNVKLIDMEGAKLAGRDVVHVIACDIASAVCDDGTVRNHGNDDLQKNSVDIEFSALTTEQRADAERLFRYRDCAYKDLRENVKFGVLYNHSIWADCEDKSAKIYHQLREDPSYMYKALVDQVTCPKSTGHPIPRSNRVSMSDALNGVSAKKSSTSGGGVGGFFFELLIFVGMLASAMVAQYLRMSNTNRLVVGGSTIQTTTPIGSLEETEGQFANDVDAEYRDGDSDGENDIPPGFKD